MKQTPTPPSPDQPVNMKPTDDSLLKMVIAMAIDVYGYDPEDKKSTATADIVAALDNCGLSLPANTIRQALEQGALLLPRDEKQHKP